MSSRRVRWISTGLSAGLLLLLAANVPFYAGSAPVDGFSWRMEGGRVELWRSDVQSAHGIWVALNNEGLKWAPRARIHGADDWRVFIPLWIPLLGALAWCAWTWRAPRGVRAQS